MSLYEKNMGKDSFDYQFYRSLGFPPINTKVSDNLILRFTLGDMELIDGLYLPLPPKAEFLSIEEAIEKNVVCNSTKKISKLKKYLSKFPNPDLIDILNMLCDIYRQKKAGKVNIKYHINNGKSDVQPDEPIYLHQQVCVIDDGITTYKLIDIVIDISSAIDPFYLIAKEQKTRMLDDFRQAFILYMADKFGRFPDPKDMPEISNLLSALLNELASDKQGLISFDNGEWHITPKGYDILKSMVSEAEFYIDNYDLFGDVYVKGYVKIMFNTGYGDNLIVPVFLREGIDPYRALFLIAVYLGNMDELVSDLRRLFLDKTFVEFFDLISNSPDEETIGSGLLSRIIIEGKSKIIGQNLRNQRIIDIKNINKRMNLL